MKLLLPPLFHLELVRGRTLRKEKIAEEDAIHLRPERATVMAQKLWVLWHWVILQLAVHAALAWLELTTLMVLNTFVVGGVRQLSRSTSSLCATNTIFFSQEGPFRWTTTMTLGFSDSAWDMLCRSSAASVAQDSAVIMPRPQVVPRGPPHTNGLF